MCKDGVRVLNFARGELVDTEALLDAMNSGKVAQYFCDFPAEELLGVKGVYCTPHLGASTPESETNCAVMAAAELSDYLKNGNIAHSVNLPDVSQPRVGRPPHLHDPQESRRDAISAITSILTTARLNIRKHGEQEQERTVAYTLLDVTGDVTPRPDQQTGRGIVPPSACASCKPNHFMYGSPATGSLLRYQRVCWTALSRSARVFSAPLASLWTVLRIMRWSWVARQTAAAPTAHADSSAGHCRKLHNNASFSGPRA